MSIVDKFGEKVGEIAENDPVKARKLLLAGYRLQEKRLALFPDRKLPMSGQYVAKIVMNNIIQALAKPENAAMVSIFVPGELLTAAGLTPYSVEALSCFIAGTKCEQAFLRQTEKEGFPETMCSYHRVFLGAALNGIVPKPKCMVYTNLAWYEFSTSLKSFFGRNFQAATARNFHSDNSYTLNVVILNNSSQLFTIIHLI